MEFHLKDYIHFNIKTVKNINDFDSMYEVVKRRYLFLKIIIIVS